MKLFVYGTLRQAGSHGHMIPGARIPAVTRGRLIGLPEGYPALVDAPTGIVVGECADILPQQLPELDIYEEVGEHIRMYQRRPRTVYINGCSIKAECYLISVEGEAAWLKLGAYPIDSGDWLNE